MKISLELKDRIDQKEVRAEIMATMDTEMSLDEIEEAVRNFDVEKAIEEAAREKVQNEAL